MTLQPGKPEDVGMSSQRLRRLEELAEGWVASGLHSALALIVARKGVIVLARAFGQLRPDPDSPPLRLDSIFPVASITKPITATAAMILVEDGKLGLNRRVQEYIPEFQGQGKEQVMVHHLLTHTSGLRDEDVIRWSDERRGRIEVPAPEATQHPIVQEHLHLGYEAPLWKAPGQEMSYCSYGYNLLGEIVRRVSGSSLADFARERIFAPLGMNDTSYIVPDQVRDRVVLRPPTAPGALVLPPAWFGLNTRERQDVPLPSGGVFSTALDIAIFGQTFLDRGSHGAARILSPASVALMTRNQIPGVSATFGSEYFPEASFGFGWDVPGRKHAWIYGSLASPRTFEHVGNGGTQVWVDPDHAVVGVYFSTVLEQSPDGEWRWAGDLFQNAVIAAVESE